MLLSSRPLKRDVFFCPEESNFYSYCLENLVLSNSSHISSIVEFGSGDGCPILKALLRTDFEGVIHGFEISQAACEVAKAKIKEHRLNDYYVIHNKCLFESAQVEADCLISNPPYLPALDNNLYQPLLHGGTDGITITKKLISLGYDNVMVMAASYSNPEGLIDYAIAKGYCVSDFLIAPLSFGYYSSEPKVRERIAELRQQNQAFYSDNLYLLAGVLFTQRAEAESDRTAELVQLMTAL